MIHIYETMEQNKQKNQHCKKGRLLELANLVLEELSSGLYYVQKDRMDVFGVKQFIDVREVAGAMNRRDRTVIIANDGRLYANTDFIPEID